jgi:hypothetical protein
VAAAFEPHWRRRRSKRARSTGSAARPHRDQALGQIGEYLNRPTAQRNHRRMRSGATYPEDELPQSASTTSVHMTFNGHLRLAVTVLVAVIATWAHIAMATEPPVRDRERPAAGSSAPSRCPAHALRSQPEGQNSTTERCLAGGCVRCAHAGESTNLHEQSSPTACLGASTLGQPASPTVAVGGQPEAGTERPAMHPEEVRCRAKRGLIPASKPGRRWVFIDNDLAAFLRGNYLMQRQALRVSFGKGNAPWVSANEAPSGGRLHDTIGRASTTKC